MTRLCVFAEPRPLGKSDILVSPMAWGMWRLADDDIAAVRALVDAALDAGITLFETADIRPIPVRHVSTVRLRHRQRAPLEPPAGGRHCRLVSP